MLMQTTVVQQKDIPHRSINSCINQILRSHHKESFRDAYRTNLKPKYIFSLMTTLSRPCSASSWWYLSHLSLQVTIP